MVKGSTPLNAISGCQYSTEIYGNYIIRYLNIKAGINGDILVSCVIIKEMIIMFAVISWYCKKKIT